MNRREFVCRRRYSRGADRSALLRSGATIQHRVYHIRGAEPATTWAGDRFRGFTEAREIGFHSAETCATSFREFYPDDVASLRKRMGEIGVPFAAITGGAQGGNTPLEDPAARQAVIENHLGVVRFPKKFGCNHEKTDSGARRRLTQAPGGRAAQPRTSRTSPRRSRNWDGVASELLISRKLT